MPISSGVTSATQTGGNVGAMLPGSQATGASLAQGGVQAPAIPQFNMGGVQGSTDPTYQNIIGMLSQAPTSQVNTIMPYLQSLFGQQGSMAQGMFQQQGAQGAAQAQSSAMARGLTGSSIEQMGMGQAYASANQGYDQFMMNAMTNLGSQYASLAGADIQAQTGMRTNLAQAMGQEMTNEQQQRQFEQMMQESRAQEGRSHLAGQQSALMGMGGSILGGAAAGLMMPSDIRLKKNIKKIGNALGLDIFSFEYEKEGHSDLDLPSGEHRGFMAHHVAEKYPDAVSVNRGYLQIDYSKLPVVA